MLHSRIAAKDVDESKSCLIETASISLPKGSDDLSDFDKTLDNWYVNKFRFKGCAGDILLIVKYPLCK